MSTIIDSVAVGRFVGRLEKARKAFRPTTLDHSAWLEFYEEKHDAAQELFDKVPAIAEMAKPVGSSRSRFWGLVQTSDGKTVTERLTQEIIDAVKHRVCKGLTDAPCAIRIKYPATLCKDCEEAHKRILEKRKAQRKAVLAAIRARKKLAKEKKKNAKSRL